MRPLRIPAGFRIAGARCGLKNRRNDVGLIVADEPCQAAALFTTNRFRAPSIDFSRAAVAEGKVRGCVVNSGNANCATGEQGIRDTARMAQLAAAATGCEGSWLVASTGIIGQPLNMQKLERGVMLAAGKLGTDASPFVEAILTTDLVEKWAQLCVSTETIASPKTVPGEVVGPSVLGIAKGSGMIAPNMATMLGYILTDLDLSEFDAHQLLVEAAGVSLNCLTVDSDTSTNDSVVLLASGASGVKPSRDDAVRWLTEVGVDLAKQIARDGEGATKLVQVQVRAPAQAARIARTIADSPLVKTAMFGCDPNWGRILAAAGRSGVEFDVQRTSLAVRAGGSSFLLFQNGEPQGFDPARVSAALKSDEIELVLDCGGTDSAVIYTCDLGYGYVRINAEYHT